MCENPHHVKPQPRNNGKQTPQQWKTKKKIVHVVK